MKKLLYLLAFLLLLPLFAVISNAQNNYRFDPEKIYLFDTNVTVHTDGSISVTENITLNVKHDKIRHGIYRDFPNLYTERPVPVSLEIDGREHPFFTEKNGRNIRINFGNDDYIPQGVHTYTFKYNYTGAINFLKDYDEIYWNVTGNNWDFTIDKAKVQIFFPPEVNVLEDGISLYTGKTGSKENYTMPTGYLSYETTRPLYSHDGFTIAVPFEKGAVTPPQGINKTIKAIPSIILALVILISVILFTYFISTWVAIGIDPSYKIAPQYQPPQGMSPAFMKYLYDNEKIDSDMFACSILRLAMEEYIQIKQLDNDEVELTLLKEDTDKLSEDEKIIIKNLFKNSKTYTLKPYSSSILFATITRETSKLFSDNAKLYIKRNTSFINFAALLFFIAIFLPFGYIVAKGLLFYNYGYDLPDLPLNIFPDAVANLLSAVYNETTNMGFDEVSAILSIIGGVLCLFFNFMLIGAAVSKNNGCSIGCLLVGMCVFFIIFLVMQQAILPWACQIVFIITAIGFAWYSRYIGNVTEEGKELFYQIYGFKHYLKRAEQYRVAASSPLEQEKVFCDFLPYAFAFNMENRWIKKFEDLLSAAVIQRCTQNAGGTDFIKYSLAERIDRSSSVRSSSGSSGSSHSSGGSWGGGSSGGGHGSSGGGGR